MAQVSNDAIAKGWLVVYAAATVLAWVWIAERPEVVAAVPDPPLARVAEFDIPSRRCHATGMEPPRLKCAPDSSTLVWGDSMAFAWMGAFAGASEATRDSCAPIVGYLPNTVPTLAEVKCRDWNAVVLERAKQSTTVVLVAYWMRRPDVSSLSSTLVALKNVPRVVLVGPTPVLPEPVPDCIRKHLDCSIPRAKYGKEAAPILAQMHAFAKRFPNVEVIDVADRFCDSVECPAVLNGVPLYWDTHHVSKTAARMALANALASGTARFAPRCNSNP